VVGFAVVCAFGVLNMIGPDGEARWRNHALSNAQVGVVGCISGYMGGSVVRLVAVRLGAVDALNNSLSGPAPNA
jgi:hypothetical protein